MLVENKTVKGQVLTSQDLICEGSAYARSVSFCFSLS